jgi:hypothetical protein
MNKYEFNTWKDCDDEKSINLGKLYNLVKQYVPEKNQEEFTKLFTREHYRYYYLITNNKYSKALDELIYTGKNNQPQFTLDDGSKIYRPLTFKENIEAQLRNGELYYGKYASCTGIAYKENSSYAKINPLSKELLTLNKNYDGDYLDVDYNSFEGEEFDIEKTSVKDKWLLAMGGINSENEKLFDDYLSYLSHHSISPWNGHYYTESEILHNYLGAETITEQKTSKLTFVGICAHNIKGNIPLNDFSDYGFLTKK